MRQGLLGLPHRTARPAQQLLHRQVPHDGLPALATQGGIVLRQRPGALHHRLRDRLQAHGVHGLQGVPGRMGLPSLQGGPRTLNGRHLIARHPDLLGAQLIQAVTGVERLSLEGGTWHAVPTPASRPIPHRHPHGLPIGQSMQVARHLLGRPTPVVRHHRLLGVGQGLSAQRPHHGLAPQAQTALQGHQDGAARLHSGPAVQSAAQRLHMHLMRHAGRVLRQGLQGRHGQAPLQGVVILIPQPTCRLGPQIEHTQVDQTIDHLAHRGIRQRHV